MSAKPRKIAVTGAAGLLGRHLVASFAARGDHVLAIDNRSRAMMFDPDASRPCPPAEVLANGVIYGDYSFDLPHVLDRLVECDAIVHAAAQTSHPRSIGIPMLDFEVNALGTLRLLEKLRLACYPGRLIYVGSCKVYGENVAPTDWVKETNARLILECHDRQDPRLSWFDDVDGALCVSERCPIDQNGIITPFGVSKAAAELYCANYAKLYGLDVCVLRPGCFTGQGSGWHQLQNWIPPIVNAAVNGDKINVYGFKGKQVRDVLHVSDLSRCCLAMLDSTKRWSGEIFNACGGAKNSISILELVDMLGIPDRVVLHDKRPGDWPFFVGSNQKITQTVGWSPIASVVDIVTEIRSEAESALR